MTGGTSVVLEGRESSTSRRSKWHAIYQALMWGRGAISAVTLVGFLSMLGGEITQQVLKFSAAFSFAWSEALATLLNRIELPFETNWNRRETAWCAFITVVIIPASIAAIKGSLKLRSSELWRQRFRGGSMLGGGIAMLVMSLVLITVYALYETDAEPFIRSEFPIQALVGFLSIFVLWVYSRPFVKALFAGLSFFLVLDAMYYAPVVGSWIAQLTVWLESL